MENFLVDTRRGGEAATKQLDFSLHTDIFHSFGYIVISAMYVGKMFIRFLSIIFYIYCSLAPQLSCIMVRLSGGMFLSFAASD